jgi:putative Holliday junction resolvase
LAFDFGTRRTGVAVGELGLGIAHPLQTISATSDLARMREIGALIREWAPVLLVVGLPAHMDRTEHAISARSRRFAAQLQRGFGIDTRLVDERLSSAAAAESLAAAGVRGRRQKHLLDQLAAVHILQTFFTGRDDAA